MLKNYLLITFRNLWKNKVYSLLNIFGLAIGIACAALIFLWVEDEVNYDSFNVKKNSLYAVMANWPFAGSIHTIGSTPGLLSPSIKSEIPGIKNSCRISEEDANPVFNIGERSVYAKGRYADAAVFDMFTLPFVKGNPGDAFKQLYSIVITEKTARKFFGEEKNLIGKTIRLDNKQDYVVTGVLKDLPENATLQFEWLAPFEILFKQRQQSLSNWTNLSPLTYVELNASADLTFPASSLSLLHGG